LSLAIDKEGSTALYLAAKVISVGKLQNAWEWAKKKLTTEEINKLL
jgi:hypothetical protein